MVRRFVLRMDMVHEEDWWWMCKPVCESRWREEERRSPLRKDSTQLLRGLRYHRF